MFAVLNNLWATMSRFATVVCQKVLGWFRSDPRAQKAAAERQIVSKASMELASVRNTAYATSAQAEIGLQRYRSLYQQITLPEVRKELLAPAGLNVVLVGGVWRIMDQAEARSIKASHGQRKANKHHRRRAEVRLACVGR